MQRHAHGNDQTHAKLQIRTVNMPTILHELHAGFRREFDVKRFKWCFTTRSAASGGFGRHPGVIKAQAKTTYKAMGFLIFTTACAMAAVLAMILTAGRASNANPQRRGASLTSPHRVLWSTSVRVQQPAPDR